MSRLSRHPRKVLAGLAAAGVLTTGMVCAPQVAMANLGTVAATTALNVRQGPGTSAPILGVLSSGEQVERRGDPQGEWTPIRYRGQDAWVFSAYISIGGLNSAAGGTATATDNVNVRAGASTLAAILGLLRVGDSVAVTGDARGGWVPISYNGRDAFVYAAYLSFDSSTSAPPVSDGSSPSAPPNEPSGGTGSTATGTARVTTAVNVRSGPSTNDRVLTVLSAGQSIDVRGEAQGDWTPVIWNGKNAWVFSRYLTFGDAPATDSNSTPATTTAYTTTAVNLRTGPSIDYRIIRVLATNTRVQLTGLTQDGFSQADDDGELRWIATAYLSSSPVGNGSSPGDVQGPIAPGPNGNTSLNTGGSSGLDQLRDTTKQVVYAVRQNYPQITTMYGYRQDPLPDHPSGRAVDIMMPRGANDVDLGNNIAAYLQANANALNIEYLIWRQQIWINGQSGWTWMADRGGITANHYDHIHVTVRY